MAQAEYDDENEEEEKSSEIDGDKLPDPETDDEDKDDEDKDTETEVFVKDVDVGSGVTVNLYSSSNLIGAKTGSIVRGNSGTYMLVKHIKNFDVKQGLCRLIVFDNETKEYVLDPLLSGTRKGFFCIPLLDIANGDTGYVQIGGLFNNIKAFDTVDPGDQVIILLDGSLGKTPASGICAFGSATWVKSSPRGSKSAIFYM